MPADLDRAIRRKRRALRERALTANGLAARVRSQCAVAAGEPRTLAIGFGAGFVGGLLSLPQRAAGAVAERRRSGDEAAPESGAGASQWLGETLQAVLVPLVVDLAEDWLKGNDPERSPDGPTPEPVETTGQAEHKER